MRPGGLIYLDNHATTPCDPRVVEAMLPTFSSSFGNAASRQHALGREAEALVEAARRQVAELIHADPAEIIFTSGATESDNLALKGAASFSAKRGRHIITTVIEHKAVLDSCQRLEGQGFRVSYLPVGEDGRVRVADVGQAIGHDTILISIMHANNEIGTIQPVGEIGALAKRHGILFHCDAAQALAYLPCDVQDLGIDLLSLSAHKMYGPKGVGALYIRRRHPRVRLVPLIDGGGHERGLRSGTLNVHGIVGLGRACELVRQEREQDAARTRDLRDLLRDKVLGAFPDAVVNGSLEHRLPNNLNVSFPGVESERLLGALPGIAVSSGAACTSASRDGSYVLRSLTRSRRVIESSIRFGLGRFTTREEIELAAEETVGAVERLRRSSFPSRGEEDCAAACGPRIA